MTFVHASDLGNHLSFFLIDIIKNLTLKPPTAFPCFIKKKGKAEKVF
jgi:hypothetical protein